MFVACDFENNHCTNEIIYNDGAGTLKFINGYQEANTAPYFVKVINSTPVSWLCTTVVWDGVHCNNPCSTALLKRLYQYPLAVMTNNYGILNCNLVEDENGLMNQTACFEMHYGNQWTPGTGSVGSMKLLNNTGYNAARFRALTLQADDNVLTRVNGAYVNGVEKKSIAIATTTTVTIATLGPSYPSGTSSFAGIIHITAMAGVNFFGVNNTASYVLNVSQDVGTSAIQTISAIGQTSGAAATSPSFTWTLVGTALKATSVASTNSTFSFLIFCTGDIIAS
jgi:hypothetical protein